MCCVLWGCFCFHHCFCGTFLFGASEAAGPTSVVIGRRSHWGLGELLKRLAEVNCEAPEELSVVGTALCQQLSSLCFLSVLFEWVVCWWRRIFWNLILDPGLLRLDETAVLAIDSSRRHDQVVGKVFANLSLTVLGRLVVASGSAHVQVNSVDCFFTAIWCESFLQVLDDVLQRSGLFALTDLTV